MPSVSSIPEKLASTNHRFVVVKVLQFDNMHTLLQQGIPLLVSSNKNALNAKPIDQKLKEELDSLTLSESIVCIFVLSIEDVKKLHQLKYIPEDSPIILSHDLLRPDAELVLALGKVRNTEENLRALIWPDDQFKLLMDGEMFVEETRCECCKVIIPSRRQMHFLPSNCASLDHTTQYCTPCHFKMHHDEQSKNHLLHEIELGKHLDEIYAANKNDMDAIRAKIKYRMALLDYAL